MYIGKKYVPAVGIINGFVACTRRRLVVLCLFVLWSSSYGQRSMTFLNLVGLENSGHHLWYPTLEILTRHCGKKWIDTDSLSIEIESHKHNERLVKEMFRKFGDINSASDNVMVFWSSFPASWIERLDPLDSVKRSSQYNITWVLETVDELKKNENITTISRYVYLNRNRFDTTAGKCDADVFVMGSTCMHTHVLVLEKFLKMIAYVYESINSTHPGIWTAVNMEWLYITEQCEEVFRDLVTFLQCDIDKCDLAAVCAASRPKPSRKYDIAIESNPASICTDFYLVHNRLPDRSGRDVFIR
jgi:hypothetical protein